MGKSFIINPILNATEIKMQLRNEKLNQILKFERT